MKLLGRLAFVLLVLCAYLSALFAALAILCLTERRLLIKYVVLSFVLPVLLLQLEIFI